MESGPTSVFGWVYFLAQKYSDMFIEGTWITLYIAVLGTILGFALGFVIGVIQDSKISQYDNPIKKGFMHGLKIVSTVYVEVFRDTPMIVQAMIVYYGLRQTTLGAHMTPVFAGILVTVLNTGAYMAMGMSTIKTMVFVVLPQAFKNIIPEMANTFLTNLKMTSVLNVIAVKELFMAAKTVGGNYYKYFEAYLVIAAIYFVLCYVFNKLFNFMEKKMQDKADYVLAVEYLNDNE